MLVHLNGRDLEIRGYEAYEQDFRAVAHREYSREAEEHFHRWLDAFETADTGFPVRLFSKECKSNQTTEFWFDIHQEDGETWYEYVGVNAEGASERRPDFQVIGLEEYLQDFRRYANEYIQNLGEARLVSWLESVRTWEYEKEWFSEVVKLEAGRESIDSNSYYFDFDVQEEAEGGKRIVRYVGVRAES